MNADFRRKLVRRLDILFFIGLLVTSALAAFLFATEFYDNDEADADSGAPSMTPTTTPTYTHTPFAPSSQPDTLTPSHTPDVRATVGMSVVQTMTAVASQWTATPVPSETPSPIPPSATLVPSETPDVRATVEMSVAQTATVSARLWTPTLAPSETRVPSETPDVQATVGTSVAQTMTAAAQLWTATPVPSETPRPVSPSATPVPSETPDIDATVEVLVGQTATAAARLWTSTPAAMPLSSPASPTRALRPSPTGDVAATVIAGLAQTATESARQWTPTPSLAPTDTPLPPTATVEPSETPLPSETPDVAATVIAGLAQTATEIARLWTPTPSPAPTDTPLPSTATPDLDATVERIVAQTATQAARQRTPTTSPTRTPRPASPTMTPTPSETPDVQATVDALVAQTATQAAREWTATPSSLPPSATAGPTATNTPSPTPWPTPQVEPLALSETYAGQPLTIRGMAQLGDTIELYDQDQLLVAVTADENGEWVIGLPDGLPPGDHALTVVAVGADGNSSPPVPVGFAVDNRPTPVAQVPSPTPSSTPTPDTAPASPTLTPQPPTRTPIPPTATPTLTPSQTPDVPSPTPSGETASPTTIVPPLAPPELLPLGPSLSILEPVVINGRAEAGQAIMVAANDQPLGETTVDSEGEWSLSWQADVAGPVEITAVARDLAGRESAPAVAEIELVAPRPRIDAPAHGEVYSPGMVGMAGVAQPGNSVEIRDAADAVLATVPVSENGTWQANVNLLDEGETTLLAAVVDEDGVAQLSDPVTITLAPPVQPDTGGVLTTATDNSRGRAFTGLLALLSSAGGFSAYFAGRVLYLLAFERRKPR
ncbi:MAG: hypothetical protein GYB65_10330 [Chloroflexi bacterium]|nr:hypothetical protein [Chloroflexota bacterium]